MSGTQASKRRRSNQGRQRWAVTLADLRSLALVSEAIAKQRHEIAAELLEDGVSATDVAIALGVSRAQLYRLIAAGTIDAGQSRAPEAAPADP